MNAVGATVAAARSNKSGVIDLDTFAALVEASTVTEKVDIGVAVVIKAIHASLGTIILVNSTGAQSAVMYM